nr:unnamed protein product [Digitaria exilis]
MEAAGDGRREAALGALAVLPDEVLCAVVDLLPPADIGRLACVSRWALYPPGRVPGGVTGACLAINVDKWYSCLEEICACHSLPGPTEDEKLPVGTGSNPVFIVSGNVIKIYAEGGLVYSVHGLGTELEFYDLLQKNGSPLINHIPEIIASGFLEYKDDIYRTVPWDGKGIPDVLAKHYPLEP